MKIFWKIYLICLVILFVRELIGFCRAYGQLYRTLERELDGVPDGETGLRALRPRSAWSVFDDQAGDIPRVKEIKAKLRSDGIAARVRICVSYVIFGFGFLIWFIGGREF